MSEQKDPPQVCAMSNAFSGSGRVGNLFLAAALAYGRLGWKIFPIREGTKDRPHLKEWGVWATSNPNQISKWWTAWPRDNIGLACGPSQIAVVDIDTKEGKNGQRTIDLLELEGLRLSPTRALRTPSGGRHYLYLGDIASTVANIGAHLYDQPYTSHVDTRGTGANNGGYVLLPPSRTIANPQRHTHAGVDRWINRDPLAQVDAWVVEICGRRPQRAESLTEPVIELDQAVNIKWAIDYLQNDAPPAIEGSGGEFTTLKVAMVLRGYGISEAKTLELMLEYYNVDRKCIPLWDVDGKDGLAQKVENAFRYANLEAPGAATAEAHFKDDPPEPLMGSWQSIIEHTQRRPSRIRRRPLYRTINGERVRVYRPDEIEPVEPLEDDV